VVNSPTVQILAIDNNKDTLEIARKNADLNEVSKQIKFQKLDIFREELEDKFDLMVSNPPYIPQNEISGLPLEIRDHEPLHALTDGVDGLTFYRRFAAKGRSWVKKGGYLILEVGRGKHPQQVERIFTSAGYKNLKMIKDYNGDDRVLTMKV
jgi:release factor glutamine methyltransferase